MYIPLFVVQRSFDGGSPLPRSRFLAFVDFLAAADESDHHAPPKYSLSKFNEVLGLRLRLSWIVVMLIGDHRRVVSTLGLVVHKNMLLGNNATQVSLHILLYPSDESAAISACTSQLIGQHLHERAVS